MPTIKDVAKKAGVSVATVSRVLNKSGYVNAKTEKRVLLVIKELNYTPNAVARSLFKKQSKTIALIVPDITNPFFPELARAVEDVTSKAQFTLIQCNSDEQIEKELQYLEILKQKYIDGIILVSNSMDVKTLKALNVPVVLIDRPNEPSIPTITAKNREGAQLAVRYLLSIGCKKIAHIKGPAHVVTAKHRYEGYLDVVKSEPWFSSELIIEGQYQVNIAMEETIRLLHERQDIDGIFAGNDLMAIGALKAAQKLGINVPEELSIIGFDGISTSQMTSPELTTVAQPIYNMGAMAADKLIKMIQKQPLQMPYEELDISLVVRQTTRREKE
ncbi:LacI family DNA-binding transcriptional regulator [Aureibacillus halotolerans]|uniref:LacI family DNA-binding transcriptional regulator n=1 Tax=Aureibacillus halotolerans TaxID=1508390 RepID=UPI0010601B0B|nr:LacI family DNA-binding transcriptional regulator [Aureibacillus halotolerans]